MPTDSRKVCKCVGYCKLRSTIKIHSKTVANQNILLINANVCY